MDIRELQYFLTVAREENITKAAETLHMTQPPLSRQLKNLEEELGKQLLIRGNKRITLTEEGMLLRKRAEEIIDLMEKTKAEISSSDESISGDVYIGCGESEAVFLIASVAKEIEEIYPRIRYHIYSGDAESITERLDKGLIDFGLLVEPFDAKKYDYIRLPAKDRWGVLMRKDSPLAENECITAEELWDKPLIFSHQTASSEEMRSWFRKDFSQLNIVANYDLLYNASQFVKAGFGYSISLDKLINTSGDSELCFKPLSPPLEAGLGIVWKRYQMFSSASDVFLRKLRERFSPYKPLKK